ncbi:MAG: GNAT family N-acetyltransferase [Eubacterium sp.]
MNEEEQDIAVIREFNRYYTNLLGILNRTYLSSSYSLSEIRILYRIHEKGTCCLKDLAGDFLMDKGYLSRTVTKLERCGLIRKTLDARDKRSQSFSLTEEGEQETEKLSGLFEALIRDRISALSDGERGELAASLTRAQVLLSGGKNLRLSDIEIRNEVRTGNLGNIVRMHGRIYGREYGCTPEFEGYIAGVASHFLLHYNPQRERIWFAEHHHSVIGTIAVLDEVPEKNYAELRWFLLEPGYRGIGLGRKLLAQAVEFAVGAGYAGIQLVTTSDLEKAMSMYRKMGFTEIRRVPNDQWKKGLQEVWFLKLFPENAS